MITISKAKEHLRIDADQVEDDGYIKDLIDLATEMVEDDLGESVADFVEHTPVAQKRINQAILFLVGHFYWHREPVILGTSPVKVPMTFDYLLANIRRYGLA